MSEEHNALPRIYHSNDPDRLNELWRKLVKKVVADERAALSQYEDLFDPDRAPEQYVDLMLYNLGNPFTNIHLTLPQKRKLVQYLIPIYRQKGTRRGIFNAVRFLTGIVLEVLDPHGVKEHTWQIGLSEIGRSTWAGGDRIYSNLLNWSEDFNNNVWAKSGTTAVTSDFILGPTPWYRQADRILMPGAGDTIQQVVTPLFLGGQTFTASIWLKASANVTVEAVLVADQNPVDKTTTLLNVTTTWQRYIFRHTIDANAASQSIIFRLKTSAGFAEELYAWGAALIRDKHLQPYAPSENDGKDTSRTGRWAYHFILVSPRALTSGEEKYIKAIADFMKTEHTHYLLVHPGMTGGGTSDFIDHWEVGLSEVGLNTYVHN